MAGLKNFLKRLSAAQIIFSLIAVISLILYLILILAVRLMGKRPRLSGARPFFASR